MDTLDKQVIEDLETAFNWTLNYDGRKVCAKAGEIILIPKGSKI